MGKNDPYLGSIIGNYSLTRKLGSGTYGSVYLAEHKYLKARKAAIKILQVLNNEKERTSFLKEANFLDLLKHPHVLPIIDVGEQDDVSYIIMEYAPGGSLAERIANRRLSMRDVLSILAQIGSALHFAHMNYIVHRDLKPANILFNEKGEVVLADFGISVLLAHGRTTRGDVVGTCPYMAPEQFKGEISFKSDQYALASIAYLLFTGKLPIELPSDATIQKWAVEADSQVPVALKTHNADVPEYIEEAILKALAKDRNQRHKDINTFIRLIAFVPDEELTISRLVNLDDHPTILSTQENTPTEVDPPKEQFIETVKRLVIEGNENFKNGNLEQALEAYKQAILIDPDKDILYNLQGNVLLALDRPKEANVAYEKAIQLAPNKSFFYIGKGDALRNLKDFNAAIKVYEHAIQLAPNNVNMVKAYIGKGDAFARLGQEKAALNDYKQACQLEPNNPLWHSIKGDMHKRLGQYEEALAEYELGIKLATEDETLQKSLQFRKKGVLKRTVKWTHFPGSII